MVLDPNDAKLQVGSDPDQGDEDFVEFENRLEHGRFTYASRKHWKEVSHNPGHDVLWDNSTNKGLRPSTPQAKAVLQAFLAALPEAAEDLSLVSPSEMGNWAQKVFRELPAGAEPISPVQTYSNAKQGQQLANSYVPSMVDVFLLKN